MIRILLDTPDIVDDVNALLKLGVGDAYRLEHIKQSYIDNKTIWITDANYLDKLREKYLIKQSSATLTTEEEPEDDGEGIHCWKCGKRNPLRANFCMTCGSSIFEVGTENNPMKKELRPETQTPRKSLNLKIPIMIGVPVLALIILGGAYTMGVFDSSMKKPTAVTIPEPTPDVDVTQQTFDPDDPISKCGPGTIYDEDLNACILEDTKCGPGTVYVRETDSCVLA